MIADYYNFVKNGIQSIADRYTQLFPDDETGDLLMDVTDQLVMDFDVRLNYSVKGSVVYAMGHTHINPYQVTLNALGLDSSRYDTQDAYDSALDKYNLVDTTISLSAQSSPFFVPPQATNSSIELKTNGVTSTYFDYTYGWFNNTLDASEIKEATRYIKVGSPQERNTGTSVNGTLVLGAAPDSNITFVSNNQSFYNRYSAKIAESKTSGYNGLNSTHGQNGLTVLVDGDHSINDYIRLFNIVLQEEDPEADPLPTYPELKEEQQDDDDYTIGKIDSIDGSLDLPAITLEPPDFSLLGDVTTYTFNWFSDFGIMIPIIFSLLVGAIVINIKR